MPVITPMESGSNRFRAKSRANVTPLHECITQQKQGEPIYRAVCKTCGWTYAGGPLTSWLVVWSKAAKHTGESNHGIRFETVTR